MTLPPFTARDWLTWSFEMVAQATVLVTALRLPRRPHIPLFVFVLLSELYMRGVEWLYLEGVAVPGAPPVGASRALYHSVQVLHTAWPAAVAALAWWVWRGPQKANGSELPEPSQRPSSALPDSSPGLPSPPRRSSGLYVDQGFSVAVAATSYYAPVSRRDSVQWPRNLRTLPLPVKAISLLWLAFNTAIIAGHPLPRGWTQPALHAFAAACVLAGAVAIVTGWPRRYERAAQIAGYLVVVELVVCIVGPWADNVFATWRTVGAGMYGVAFAMLTGWQVWVRSIDSNKRAPPPPGSS